LAKLFISAITSFSSYPLWMVFILGCILTGVSFSLGAYLLIRKVIFPQTVLSGYASILISIWFLGGLIISFLGILGLYLAGIFVETKQRPQYIIRQRYTESNAITTKAMAVGERQV
jgi:putative glycosyltransferase